MHRNNKSLILNAFFAGALLAGALALPLHAEAADQPRVITVTGEASVTALPDLARISIGVSEQATSAQEALRAMSAGPARGGRHRGHRHADRSALARAAV